MTVVKGTPMRRRTPGVNRVRIQASVHPDTKKYLLKRVNKKRSFSGAVEEAIELARMYEGLK